MIKMNREEKKELVLTTLVCLIPLMAGLLLYSKLPEEMAIHWDAQGNVDGTSSKLVGTIVLPGILALLNMVFPVLLRIDPKYENMNGKLKTLTHWLIPVIAVFCSGVTLAAALGVKTHIEIIAPMLVGVLLVLIGNYLPKTKQSYTMGIKLPWTLNSEENWNHTHRMAGFLWVIGGMMIIVSGFFSFRYIAFIAIMVVMVAVPTVYSYLYYKKENQAK